MSLIRRIVYTCVLVLFTTSVSYNSIITLSQSTETIIKLQIGNNIMTVNDTSTQVDLVSLDTYPIIVRSRTLLPIRAVIEAIGGDIGWNSDTRAVTIDVTEKNIVLSMANPTYVEAPVFMGDARGLGLMGVYEGSRTIYVNGTAVENDVPAMIINSRTFMPLRFITETAGCRVEWEQATNTVIVSYGAKQEPTLVPTITVTTTKPTTEPSPTAEPTKVPTTTEPTIEPSPTAEPTTEPDPTPQKSIEEAITGLEGWDIMPVVLEYIIAPEFPDKDFSILDYGAIGDGITDSNKAFIDAITACSDAGGGRVVVPAGEYISNGPIHLKSNINLHLESGAVLSFGSNLEDYVVGDESVGGGTLTRWEGTRCYNYLPMIYAYQKENIAITGTGTIHGNPDGSIRKLRDNQGKAKATIREMGRNLVPVEDRIFVGGIDGSYLRPGFIQLYECKNILVEDIFLREPVMWTLHFVLSENITVRNVDVVGGQVNDDGINPESSKFVLIEGCKFNNHDDNLAIKAGRDNDAWIENGGKPSQYIIIRNNYFEEGKPGGFTIGSEMSGGANNIFVHDNEFEDVKYAFYIKSNTDRGGIVEDIYYKDITINNCEAVIKLETNYKNQGSGKYPSIYRNFYYENITVKNAGILIDSVGLSDEPITNLFLKNVTVDNIESDNNIKHTENVVIE